MFCKKESACSSQEDFSKPDTSQRNAGATKNLQRQGDFTKSDKYIFPQIMQTFADVVKSAGAHCGGKRLRRIVCQSASCQSGIQSPVASLPVWYPVQWLFSISQLVLSCSR